MTKTKTNTMKKVKKAEKEEESEEEEGGMSLDDAFGDDEGVEYAESKPRKEKKKKDEDEEGMDEDELEEEIREAETVEESLSDEGKRDITLKGSKPIAKVKKGDKIKVDGKEYEVDQHYVLIDHGTTKEMAIEVFDSKTDKDYQIRYFADQVERTIEFYELQEIIFVKRAFKKIEW